MVPRRLLDTRYTLGLVAAGCTVVMDTASLIPSDATAASLNVTAVGAEAPGFVTVYPCDEPVPYVSSINTRSAIPVPNAVIVPLEESRRVCLYSSVATQLIVDVDGWFGIDGEPFHGLAPERILDSRYGPRPDGRTGQFAAGTTTRIPIAGIGPVPDLATGVALNLTATEPAGPGFLTVYPCGTSPSLTSSLNFESGDTRANQVTAGLDATGAVCIYTPTTTSVIVDVTGWYGDDTGSRLTTIRATRVFDTRDGTGGAATPIGAGETRAVDVGLRGSLAVGQNVVLNLLATRSAGGGFLTVFPCGAVRTATSSLNLAQGQDVANLVDQPGRGRRAGVRVFVDLHRCRDGRGCLDRSGRTAARSGHHRRRVDDTVHARRPQLRRHLPSRPEQLDLDNECGPGCGRHRFRNPAG